MNHNFYTAEEVANLLKLSKYTVYEMVKRGELAAVKVGRQVRIRREEIDLLLNKNTSETKASSENEATSVLSKPIMFIGSHDLSIETVINTYNRSHNGAICIPAFVGSMEGLLSLYYDRADIVGSHVFDEETGTYNKQIVQRLFPGEEMIIFHFVKRNIGWIVEKGNPKKLSSWKDIHRRDLRFVNRQKGSGTRILFDHFMKKIKSSSDDINGYENEESTHYSAASVIARGEADYALGTESAALALGMDFVFLEKEQYDLIMKKSFFESNLWQELSKCILSTELQQNIKKLGGYDLKGIGTLSEV